MSALFGAKPALIRAGARANSNGMQTDRQTDSFIYIYIYLKEAIICSPVEKPVQMSEIKMNSKVTNNEPLCLEIIIQLTIKTK